MPSCYPSGSSCRGTVPPVAACEGKASTPAASGRGLPADLGARQHLSVLWLGATGLGAALSLLFFFLPQPLLRQGRPSVRTLHELEVATTEYEQDAVAAGRDALWHGAVRPVDVRVAVRGHLHLCLANVGKSTAWHPSEPCPGCADRARCLAGARGSVLVLKSSSG